MDNYASALKEFHALWRKVCRSDVPEPTAVILATANAQGRASARAVLLKEANERGFVFYTNVNSRKGRTLAVNPWAALCCYWEPVEAQVLIEGCVEPVSDAEADAYWVSRPRQSQLAAWASDQSQPLANRRTLLKRFARYTLQFAGRAVPRPAHWSGYRIVPHRIEFWRRGPFRLHERLLYEKRQDRWTKTLLYP
jgi:pyridoxamine 5'-phosphate oxidase